MEFIYHARVAVPDLGAVEGAIAELDPAVLLDADASGALRISTLLDDDDLIACLRHAGLPAAATDLERLPSVCCGGCGG